MILKESVHLNVQISCSARPVQFTTPFSNATIGLHSGSHEVFVSSSHIEIVSLKDKQVVSLFPRRMNSSSQL